jgi:hypothetical protein
MPIGLDEDLSTLMQVLAQKHRRLNPQYGVLTKGEQNVVVDLADGVRVAFVHKRKAWTAHALIFNPDTQELYFAKDHMAKLEGGPLIYMWALTIIRITYTEVANMLRASDPANADFLDDLNRLTTSELENPL